MRARNGNNLVEYSIPTVLVGVLLGISILTLTDTGTLGEYFASSSNGQLRNNESIGIGNPSQINHGWSASVNPRIIKNLTIASGGILNNSDPGNSGYTEITPHTEESSYTEETAYTEEPSYGSEPDIVLQLLDDGVPLTFVPQQPIVPTISTGGAYIYSPPNDGVIDSGAGNIGDETMGSTGSPHSPETQDGDITTGNAMPPTFVPQQPIVPTVGTGVAYIPSPANDGVIDSGPGIVGEETMGGHGTPPPPEYDGDGLPDNTDI